MNKNRNQSFEKVYLKSRFKSFINNYEIALANKVNLDIGLYFTLKDEQIEDSFYDYEFILSNEYEIELLENALSYISKSSGVIQKLFKRNNEYFIKNPEHVITLTDNSLKTIFLSRKLMQLGIHVDFKKIILDRVYTKKNNNLLISGKKPNISERYKIANEVFGVYETINKKNVSATEKHILLAHVMGCAEQTARELFNGTQVKRTPIREDIINGYLDKLK